MDIRERKGTLWKIYKMGAENLAKIEKEQKCRKNVEKNVDIYTWLLQIKNKIK